MDKLTIEQKAKAYGEAIEQAKKELTTCGDINCDAARQIFRLFPELKESENERIRKEIIDFLELPHPQFVGKRDHKTWIAWLEKQGEPKEINPSEFDSQLNRLLGQFKSLPKKELASSLSFYLNVVQNDGTYKDEKQREKKPNPYSGTSFAYNGHTWGMCARDNGVEILLDGELKAFLSLEKSFIYPIHPQPELTPKSAMETVKEEKVDNQNCVKPLDKIEPKFEIEKGKWYVCNTSRYRDFVVGKAYYCPKNGMLKPNENEMARYVAKHHFRLWTIQDAKDGDVLAYNDCRNNIWVCIFKEYTNERVYDYCTLDKESFWEYGNWNYLASFNYAPATKEQRDTLFTKMKKAGYEWDAEKKKPKEIEQKPVDIVAILKDYFATTPKEQQDKDWEELKYLNDIGPDIEIAFGAKDSELQEATYFIPKGFHAEIDGDKVVIKKGEKKPTNLAKGEDYGIDGLYNAIRILEKTLGKVEGYQTDDGILEHECAISAVKKLYEQKSVWSEEDELMWKSILIHVNSFTGNEKKVDWLKDLKERVQPQTKQEWSEEDEIKLGESISLIRSNNTGTFYYEKNELISFLKSLKDRVQPQPRQEWSEEDEKIINNIGEYLNCYGNYIVESNEEKARDVYKSVDFLKTLKDRVQSQATWKPSDEQIDSIDCAVWKMKESACYDSGLVSLFNDLKKLREK